MDLEELIELFRDYTKQLDEYDRALGRAIENNNREFGYSGADEDKRKALEELEEGLNKYIDQRIGLFLKQAKG
jgi:hypothetical protein